MNNVLIGGDGWVYYETIGGGQGARPWADGMSGVHTAMTNTLDTPVEALERALPVRVRRYTLRRGSGGAGAYRGGDGIERELEMLVAGHGLARHRAASQCAVGTGRWRAGRAGGELAAAGRRCDRGAAASRQVHRALAAGDVLRILTPGGGGWGASH